jgi:hypothetical protein
VDVDVERLATVDKERGATMSMLLISIPTIFLWMPVDAQMIANTQCVQMKTSKRMQATRNPSKYFNSKIEFEKNYSVEQGT